MKSKKGFTLIELIIVIAIMGALLAILIPSWMYYIQKSRLKTQNENAHVVFSAAQTILQDYRFKERNTTISDDQLLVGNGIFELYWDANSGTTTAKSKGKDAMGNLTDNIKDVSLASDISDEINKIFSGGNETCYRIYIENYIVKSVASGRSNTDDYIGSYPVKQEKRDPAATLQGFDMDAIALSATPNT